MAHTIPDDLLDLVTTNALGHVSAIRATPSSTGCPSGTPVGHTDGATPRARYS